MVDIIHFSKNKINVYKNVSDLSKKKGLISLSYQDFNTEKTKYIVMHRKDIYKACQIKNINELLLIMNLGNVIEKYLKQIDYINHDRPIYISYYYPSIILNMLNHIEIIR